VLPEVTLTTRRIGESHLRLAIRNPGGQPLEAIAFGAFDGPLGPALEQTGSRAFHLAGKLEMNSWGGKSRVQLRLDDAAQA
jgi:single-stranded-DNA-specific exonuclease